MRLVAWNVCMGGNPRITRLVEAVTYLEPSVLVLSEIRANTVDQWIEALAKAGLPHQTNAVAGVTSDDPYGVLIASASPHEVSPWAVPPPALSRAARVSVDGLIVTGVHAPFDLAHATPFYRWLVDESAPQLDRDSVIVGDFNADQDGEGIPLAPLFSTLISGGWVHALRHGAPDGDHLSWWSQQHGFAIDHCLVSPPLAGRLRHTSILGEIDGVATAGPGLSTTKDALSDHRPLLVELAP